MKKVKKEEEVKTENKPVVEHFYRWKKAPMVRIKGNFFGGGFNMSKNKIKAILDNAAILKDFANGKLTEEIMELADDGSEVLQP